MEHQPYYGMIDLGVAPEDLAAIAEEIAKTSSKVPSLLSLGRDWNICNMYDVLCAVSSVCQGRPVRSVVVLGDNSPSTRMGEFQLPTRIYLLYMTSTYEIYLGPGGSGIGDFAGKLCRRRVIYLQK